MDSSSVDADACVSRSESLVRVVRRWCLKSRDEVVCVCFWGDIFGFFRVVWVLVLVPVALPVVNDGCVCCEGRSVLFCFLLFIRKVKL